jgi:NADP-dependent 3-hydroxy acid dehydrogenase YdfG
MDTLSSKVAVVTGAASGIGRASAPGTGTRYERLLD